MQISPQNCIHHELIGLKAEVIFSTNPSLIGIKGKVKDETKHTLKIQISDGGVKIVPKSHTRFIFTLPVRRDRRYLPGARVSVDGTLLLSQPENRIQTKFKKSFRRRINV